MQGVRFEGLDYLIEGRRIMDTRNHPNLTETLREQIFASLL